MVTEGGEEITGSVSDSGLSGSSNSTAVIDISDSVIVSTVDEANAAVSILGPQG